MKFWREIFAYGMHEVFGQKTRFIACPSVRFTMIDVLFSHV
jgi:hypothetical protein